jgi:hypothetical protein
MGVRRQGLEPRTVALRVLVRGFLDLWRCAGIGSDLGAWLPLLSVADPRLPIVRGPSAAQLGHEEGTAGECSDARSLPSMVASSGDGGGPPSVTTSLVGKAPEESRQREHGPARTVRA